MAALVFLAVFMVLTTTLLSFRLVNQFLIVLLVFWLSVTGICAWTDPQNKEAIINKAKPNFISGFLFITDLLLY